jgi:hypothetical protein
MAASSTIVVIAVAAAPGRFDVQHDGNATLPKSGAHDDRGGSMFISPAFAQAAPSGSDSNWLGLLVLIPFFGFVFGFVYLLRQSSLRWSRRNLADQRQIAQHQQVIVKTYKGSQAEATMRFEGDSTKMAAHGYFPRSQSWAPGQWATGAFIIAVLLIFLFGLGLLILGYMLIVKPDGTLTVTFERRTAIEEKTCPRCAERIKAAALVCHFCGHEFAPGEVKKS